jgi:hypothetical protein
MISIPVVTVVFLVGVALLFMGILGGGVEVRGITIPRLPIVPRLGTIAAGAISSSRESYWWARPA